jgi:mono/diheme cytochrome c family protein
MTKKRFIGLLALITLSVVILSSCGTTSQATSTVVATTAEDHDDEAEHDDDGDEHAPDEHVAGHDYVPEEAAAVQNPFEATAENISAGAELYAASCAVCHGETGEGDGPGAEGLETLPADLHEDHVQGLTDGALYYVISHGKPETPMPAWENVLSKDERWFVINFIRTFEAD